MKLTIVLCLLYAGVFALADQDTSNNNKLPIDLINSGLKSLSELLRDSEIEQDDTLSIEDYTLEVDETDNKNPIFKIVANALKGILSKPIAVPVIGKPDGLVYIENATITGLDQSYLKIASQKLGYKLDNLTIAVPEIIVQADKYKFDNLNLGVITLTGEGKLWLSIQDLFFSTKMKLKMANLQLIVTNLDLLQITAQNSKFELENLGGSPQISELLNGIAQQVLPILLRSLTNDLGGLIEEAGGDCQVKMDVLCSIIGTVVNALKDSL